MVQALTSDEQTKELLKQVIVEVFQEQQEWFAEALEDAVLVRAIREGEDSPIVGRDAVLTRLERAN